MVIIMNIKCNNYKTKDIIRFMRDCTEKTQKEFAKDLNKTRDWCAKIEGGNSNILLEDFLELARLNKIDIIMKKLD